MPQATPFSDFLSTIAFRGRNIIGIRNANKQVSNADVIELCHQLLSSKGEASGIALSFEILNCYQRLSHADKTKFFKSLYHEFSAKSEDLTLAAKNYLEDPSLYNMGQLADATEPMRRKLFIRLNLAPNATQLLINMRSDLLDRLKEHEELRAVDRDFVKLFASWFNGGFLQLRSMEWESSASILEKIIQYEAVHGMDGWDDLKQRIVPKDRLIYGFFHPRLHDEPLIFVEVALMKNAPTKISDILDNDREQLNPKEAKTAVFYSISNCQKGLRGIPLGSFLIKQVVEDLKQSFGHVNDFVTLSPVPNFGNWVDNLIELNEDLEETRIKLDADILEKLKLLKTLDWTQDAPLVETLKPTITTAIAWYLSSDKNRKSHPTDPVAKFHLGNGARLDRINWPADISKNGLKNAYGAMVNYRYNLDEIERNHERFVEMGAVEISTETARLAKTFDKSLHIIDSIEDETI